LYLSSLTAKSDGILNVYADFPINKKPVRTFMSTDWLFNLILI